MLAQLKEEFKVLQMEPDEDIDEITWTYKKRISKEEDFKGREKIHIAYQKIWDTLKKI